MGTIIYIYIDNIYIYIHIYIYISHLLRRRKADVNALDASGRSALFFSSSGNCAERLLMLARSESRPDLSFGFQPVL